MVHRQCRHDDQRGISRRRGRAARFYQPLAQHRRALAGIELALLRREQVHHFIGGLVVDVEAHGACYGVVLNSGIARDGAFPMLGGEDWDQVLRTNLDGFYNVLHPLVMPLVRARQPARIVTLSSVSGLIGNRGQVNYSASKAGIIGATKALATELASRRITVNCVAPGLIETDMVADMPETVQKQILDHIPLGRLGQPEEVAAAVRFLLSPEAAYITRQVISVNGGMA